MRTNVLDPRRAKLTAVATWGVGLAGAVLIAPVIFLAVKGIVGLAIAAVTGLAVVNFAPLVGMKFANWKLKGMKHEARANPIETRQNQAVAARRKLVDAARSLTDFSAEVRNFDDEVKQLKKEQPDAADFDEQLTKMHRLLQMRQASHRKAVAEVEAFEEATRKAERKWKVAQSALRMQQLSGADQDDAMNKILAEESLDSVQTTMNRAMAELDMALTTEGMKP